MTLFNGKDVCIHVHVSIARDILKEFNDPISATISSPHFAGKHCYEFNLNCTSHAFTTNFMELS